MNKYQMITSTYLNVRYAIWDDSDEDWDPLFIEYEFESKAELVKFIENLLDEVNDKKSESKFKLIKEDSQYKLVKMVQMYVAPPDYFPHNVFYNNKTWNSKEELVVFLTEHLENIKNSKIKVVPDDNESYISGEIYGDVR